MQSSSKELSTLVTDRVLKWKQTNAAAAAAATLNTVKLPLANVVLLLAERSET